MVLANFYAPGGNQIKTERIFGILESSFNVTIKRHLEILDTTSVK